MSWIIPNSTLSEHPPASVAAGMNYVTGLVNVGLPATLKGRGQQVVTVTVNGQATNMAQLLFQ